MMAINPPPSLEQKHITPTTSSRCGRKKRRLNNKWVLDGSIYSELPDLAQGHAHPFSPPGIETGLSSPKQIGRGDRNTSKTGNYMFVPFDSRSLARESASRTSCSSPPLQSMSTPANMEYRFKETSSSASVVAGVAQSSHRSTELPREESTSPRSQLGEPPSEIRLATQRDPRQQYHKSSSSRHASSASRPIFAEPNAGKIQPGLPTRNAEAPAVLWPLPIGDPVLPVDLQAVPYPTSPVVRPPVSPLSQYQHDQGPHLPPITQLIDIALQNDAISLHSRSNCAEPRSDEDMVGRKYAEGLGFRWLNQSAGFESTISPWAVADDGEHSMVAADRPYGAPLETEDGLRLGFMRFYRQDDTRHVEWAASITDSHTQAAFGSFDGGSDTENEVEMTEEEEPGDRALR